MSKFIPYEKLSKKEQQKINKAKRGTWGELNPVTRKPQNTSAGLEEGTSRPALIHFLIIGA